MASSGHTLSAFMLHAQAILEQVYEAREAKAVLRLWLQERLNLRPYEFALHQPDELPQDVVITLHLDLKQLEQGMPVQYVLGYAHFAGLKLKVAPGVLIPRPETEELVLWALESLPASGKLKIVDACTGSGAIALALKEARAEADLTGTDISAEALAVANANAQSLHLPVSFLAHDLLGARHTDFHDLDLLISNPPYIPQAEYHTLEPHVRDQEPALALFVPDADPFIFYRALGKLGRAWLKPKGLLLVEVHAPLANQVVELFSQLGWGRISLKPDMQGRERMVLAQN